MARRPSNEDLEQAAAAGRVWIPTAAKEFGVSADKLYSLRARGKLLQYTYGGYAFVDLAEAQKIVKDYCDCASCRAVAAARAWELAEQDLVLTTSEKKVEKIDEESAVRERISKLMTDLEDAACEAQNQLESLCLAIDCLRKTADDLIDEIDRGF